MTCWCGGGLQLHRGRALSRLTGPSPARHVLSQGVEHELHIKKILFARDKLRPLSEQEQMQRRNISHELRTGGGGGGGGSPARSQRGGGASASSAAVPEVDDVIAQCRNGRRAKVEEALDSGLPVDSTDEHGNTLLLIAAQQLNRPILEMLLERGANINHQNVRCTCPCPARALAAHP